MLKNITEATDLRGKRVLLRLDLNEPIIDGKVADSFRIRAAIPTINLLRDAGAKIVIISHLDEVGNKKIKKIPKKATKDSGSKGPIPVASLKPIADYFTEKKIPVKFIEKYFVVASQKVLDGMKDGDVVLFENVRGNKGETENDPKFAAKLAAMGDIYVNEAFPVSHRKHASIVGVPKLLPSYAGPVFMREVKNLSQAFKPEKPFLFILGGAKFDTKMPLIQKFLPLADFIFVGGALANNFYKELGFEVGKSTVSDGIFKLPELLETKKVFIPVDVVTETHRTKLAHKLTKDEKILDAGPQSLIQLADLVKQSKFILWNGPLGNYEDGFSEGTKKLAEIISRANAKSVVGGGDTVAAIQSLGLLDKFSFVSTGGGAMLDFLANETLPGIEAMEGR